MDRPQICKTEIEQLMPMITKLLIKRFEEKSYGAAVSLHEIWGILGEEVKEFEDAVHENSLFFAREELEDVAVAALLGILSIGKISNGN